MPNDIREPPTAIAATRRSAIAEQLLAIAQEHGLAVRPEAELDDLLARLGVQSPVPVEVLATVSEILSYLYRANSGTAAEAPR